MSIARDIVKIAKRVARAILASEVRTHVPAQVVSYTAATNLCSVQPCINVMRTEDPNNLTSVQLPVIEDVPVRQFGSGKCLMTIAPQTDSYGVLHVSDRDLESWITQGGIVDPSSGRKFNISSSFFEPGAYPIFPDGNNGLIVPPINTDRIEMRTRLGTTYVSVVDDETVEIANALGSITLDVAGNVAINGTADFAVAYTDLKTAFDTLKAELNALITQYNAHIHVTTATIGAGATPGVISPTVSQGVSAVADMSGAQVATVKLP